MARVKRGVVSKRKHNKIFKLNKGDRGTKRKNIRVAKEARLHADSYSFHGRKRRKQDMRSLWILRIGQAAKKEGVSYSVFINKLKKAKVDLDRKTLSELITNDLPAFKKLLNSVKNV